MRRQPTPRGYYLHAAVFLLGAVTLAGYPVAVAAAWLLGAREREE